MGDSNIYSGTVVFPIFTKTGRTHNRYVHYYDMKVGERQVGHFVYNIDVDEVSAVNVLPDGTTYVHNYTRSWPGSQNN